MDRRVQLEAIWKALQGADTAPLHDALSEHARWRAVDDGPWNCENRGEILEVVGRNLEHGLSGEIVEVTDVGQRVLVVFRRTAAEPSTLRHIVLTFAGERVSEMKACADRESALAYAAAP